MTHLTDDEERLCRRIHAYVKRLPCQTRAQARCRVAMQAMCVLAGFTRPVSRGEMFCLLADSDGDNPLIVKEVMSKHWQHEVLRQLGRQGYVRIDGAAAATRYVVQDSERVAALTRDPRLVQELLWPQDYAPSTAIEEPVEPDDSPGTDDLREVLVERLESIARYLSSIGETMERLEGLMERVESKLDTDKIQEDGEIR